MYNVASVFIYFMIYAFFGYICEVVYVFLCTKKLTNRGYLYGPVVPIYGYGAIGMVFALKWVYDLGEWYSPILVFVLGFLLTSALEYATSWAMELIFHMRWWDYSDKFGNINGRVCLRNSSMFGALVLIVMYVVHPFVVTKAVDFIASWGSASIYIVAGILLAINIVDTIFSTIKHVNISKIIRKLESMAVAAEAAIVDKAHEAQEKLGDIKENLVEKKDAFATVLSGKASELKKYFEDNAITRAITKVNEHYPSMRVRSKETKERLTFSELMTKIKNVISNKE